MAMHLFMVVRLRLEYPLLQWWLNFCSACIPSKPCHNCNVESDRALCARGWGLPAWPRALHRACGAWEDSGIWGWLWRRWAGTAAALWAHALAASPAPRPWAVNLRSWVHRGGRCWDSHSQVRQSSSVRHFWDVFSASLHPQALLSDCRESCFCRQPSLQQSVDICAFAVQIATAQAVHRSSRERTRPGWAEAAKLLGYPASPGKPEQLSIQKGSLAFLELICSSIASHFQSFCS